MPSCSSWPQGRSSPGAAKCSRWWEKTPGGENPGGKKLQWEKTSSGEHPMDTAPSGGAQQGQGVRLCPLTPAGTGAAHFVGLIPPGTGLRVAQVPLPSFLPPPGLCCVPRPPAPLTHIRGPAASPAGSASGGLAAPGPITSALFIRAATKERGGDVPGLLERAPPLPTLPANSKRQGRALQVNMGHSMSCTSLSTSVRKSTVTSRSPLGTAVKDAPWEGEGLVAAGGGPQIFVACGPSASSVVDPNHWTCLRATWCHRTWLGVGLGWLHVEI